jgi:outer membrane receptor protein involved in Fe transport
MKANYFKSQVVALYHSTARSAAAISIAIVACASTALAQSANAPSAPADAGSASATNVTKLPPTTVFGKLDVAREQIVPSLGATAYGFNQEQIQAIPGGVNAPFNQLLLRAPGVAQDSAANGDLHVRGEHANLQYRINDVLLPEGISGFGQELDTRFVDSLQLVTGSLPAQYGFRTAGVVDIHTKSGAFTPGGEVSMYGGSYDTIKPGFEVGGSKGNLNYFADGTYTHNGIGIENPTGSSTPIHDDSDQFRAFSYLSYVLDDTSRISLLGSASYSKFEVPNTPGLPPGQSPSGTNWGNFIQPPVANFDSVRLDERQNEENYYGVAAYQKSVGDLNFQLAVYGRYSGVHFKPDPTGDLFFNGVASDVDRAIYSGGFQGDLSYALNDQHTLRGGAMVLDEVASTHSTTSVFPTDSNGDPTNAPSAIPDNNVNHALFVGVYLQDEWRIVPKLTLNYGARFDLYHATFDKENQPSPRVNLIYQPTDATTLHAGYARYFTPPPLEAVNSTSVHKFDNTSNASETDQADHPKAERANYFDAGISQKLAPGLRVGLDGYYKNAVSQLDDGLFGQTLILSAFNYAEGEVYGAEFTGSYNRGGFASYANVAYGVAKGKDWTSSQFLFSQADLAYVKDNYIHLDHDQTWTGSFGVSYLWKLDCGSTRVFADAIYGSGLRTSVVTPNDATVPSYYSVNLGVEQGFKIQGKEHLKARFDVVNITDNIYQLRNGNGIGVNAAQYGMRLGFFGGLSYVF